MRAIVHFLACFVFLSISVNGQVLFGPQESVSKNPGISRAVFAGDMDGDGDEDILYSNYLGNSMFWCENYIVDNTITPLPGFQFSTGRLITDEAEGVESIYVADLDRDGDLDVLSASTHYDEVVWYENNGNGVFGNKNIITNEVDNPYSIFAADIDLDGDLDVLSASGFDSKIAWYENNGVGGFGEQNVISTSFYDTRSVYASDLDGDGDMDVLSASGFDGKIAWYENDGKGKFLDPYIVSVQVASANTAFAIDLDGDGDNDVLSASYKKIAWYENDGNANFGDQIIISTTVENPTSLYATDFDSDGKNDILVSSFEEQKIVWYKNLGNGEFSDELIIGSDLEDVYSCYVADVDEDGNKDVFSTTNNQLIWYKNLTKLHQIEVFSFQDFNYDGVYDESDNPFPNQKFSLTPSAKVKFSNSAGTTYYFAKNGEYELKHQENTLWELTTQPEVHSIEINENSELPIYYFGFKPTRILPRVEPHLSSSPTRCNTSAIYWLSYSNTGTTIGAGVVTLEVDELMDFIEATPQPDVIENGTLTWYFSDLYPSYHNKIRLEFRMPNQDFMGEIMETQATVQLFNESEELVGSKTTEYSSVIRCSYDPNDKLTRSNLLGQSEFAYLEDTILYTIRFQNTGNDTAFNIRIEDKLNKKLDWTTFHPITASHDYHTTLNRETGLVNFYFDNILLPDSGTNQIGSNGFVTFGIASLANIGDKTEVDNTAFIFFDFNPPIITNTAILTLIQQVETDIEVSDARYSIAVYPNPFSDFTTIEVSGLSSGNYRLELMDIFGRKLRELKVENGKLRIERGDLDGGLYLFQVLKEGGELVGMGKILVE